MFCFFQFLYFLKTFQPKLPKAQVIEEPPVVVVAEPPRPPSPPNPTMPLDAQLSVRTHQTETYPNNIVSVYS